MTPHISARGRAMPASPIRKLMPVAEEAKRRGVKVFHLNIGQPDLETPAVMRARLGRADKVFAYTPSNGTSEYLESLRFYYSRLGLELELDELIATTGGSEALLFAFFACTGAGDLLQRLDRPGAACLAGGGEAGREDFDGTRQVFLLEHVGDSHLVVAESAGGVEAGRGRHHDGRLLMGELGEEVAREVFAVLDRQPGDEVEGALGLAQEDSGNRRQALEQQIPAALVLLDDGGEIFLAELDCAARDELRESGRRETTLGHAQRRLVDLGVPRRQRAQPDAAGAVAFREAVDEDDVVLETGQRERRDRLGAVVNELAVDLVGDEEEAVVAAE